MEDYSKDRRNRDLKAAKEGEGAWRNKKSGKWCSVDVTFYPETKLWITENGKRVEIDRVSLETDYAQLAI